MATTPILDLTKLENPQHDDLNYSRINVLIRILEVLVQLSVEAGVTSPQTGIEGRAWRMATGSDTGAWAAGDVHDIAIFTGGTWYFVTPNEGLWLHNKTSNVREIFDGTSWVNQ